MEPLYLHRDVMPHHFSSKCGGGFTLIELMVVLTIITVLSGIVLSSQSSFNKTLILSNTAYDIALTLRSVETYGLSSRGLGIAANVGYGIRFSSGTPGSFILFSDVSPLPNASNCHGLPSGGASAPDAKPGNCTYDGSSEKISEYVLGNGITISDICAYVNGSPSCVEAHGGGVSSLDIVFVRPDPNPFMSVNGAYSSITPVTAACLTIKSAQGGFRYVSVAASGQIIANAAACL